MNTGVEATGLRAENLARNPMGEQQELLDELYSLIYEQTRALGGTLNEEQTNKCKIRAARIEELFARIKDQIGEE